MKKKLILLLFVFFLLILIISSQCIDNYDILSYRIFGAIILCLGVTFFWTIIIINLLKSEPKFKSENMSERYVEVSSDELKRYGIDYEQFKLMIYKQFQDIHVAIANFDYEILKLNLTNDLYKSYVNELKKIEGKGYQNIVKDFEFVSLKIYEINDIHINVYLNVKMYDFIINNINECIYGDSENKKDFEFELTFMNNVSEKNKYIMSKKTCINEIKVKK